MFYTLFWLKMCGFLSINQISLRKEYQWSHNKIKWYTCEFVKKSVKKGIVQIDSEWVLER